MSLKERLPDLEPDGLYTPVVGEWAYKKYLRVWMYDEIFTTAMREKFTLVYLDLFAGAGRAELRNSGRIVPSSALLALEVPHRYDRYIFCEADPRRMEALKARLAALAPEADIHFVEGDINQNVDAVRALVPSDSLSFCFVDPYGIGIQQQAIARLAHERKMDFLILLALGMDANRNVDYYLKDEIKRLDNFLGNTGWREEWKEAKREGTSFQIFLAGQYVQAMVALGYEKTDVGEMYQMRSEPPRKVKLYYLAFFSRSKVGKKFWKEVLKYSSDQTSMFDTLGF